MSDSDWNATWRPSAEIDGPNELLLLVVPSVPVGRLTRVVVWVTVSRTYTLKPSLSLGARLSDSDWNATWRPSAEIDASSELALLVVPSLPVGTLASVVVCASRSRTYTLVMLSLSLAARLSESDSKTTWRPSAEIDGSVESLLLVVPSLPVGRLTRVVVCASRSRTYTLVTLSLSLAARLSERDSNAT